MEDLNATLVHIVGEDNVSELLERADRIKYTAGICWVPDCDCIALADISAVMLCSQHHHQSHVDYVAYVRRIMSDPANRLVGDDDGEPLDDTELSPAQQAMAQHRRLRTVIRETKAAQPKPKTSAVYYIRMNDRVKIGTTTDLRSRMASFYAQPDALLAIEPGDYRRESERHKQFAHLRIARTELFEPTPELLAHIDVVRSTFGDPCRFL